MLTMQVPSWLLLMVGMVLVLMVLVPQARFAGHDYSQPLVAQVIESDVVHGAGPLARLRPGYRFSYRYVHEGRIHLGSAYRFTGGLSEAVRRHAPGQMITVFIDPLRPERSMIEPGVSHGEWLRLLVGTLLLMLAGFPWLRQRMNR